jgi:uncharacterized membrane protein
MVREMPSEASLGEIVQPVNMPPEITTPVPGGTTAKMVARSSLEKTPSHKDGRPFEPTAFEEDDAETETRVSLDAEVGEEAGEDACVEADVACEDELVANANTPPMQSPAEKIEVSSEMSAVMETLTPRERAILQVLIDRGGRSTQADLRYETRTPKSSLTGIIYSLERRKLVTKKEWGRTNVIELSEWFLSKKGKA